MSPPELRRQLFVERAHIARLARQVRMYPGDAEAVASLADVREKYRVARISALIDQELSTSPVSAAGICEIVSHALAFSGAAR